MVSEWKGQEGSVNDVWRRYVLLKERNRLLTMEEEYRHQYELFPSPERIDKVCDR